MGVVVGGGEHDDLHLQPLGRDHPGGREAVHLRHREVHEHDLRTQAPGELDRLAAVAGFTHHFVTLRLEQAPEAVTEERMVIGDQDAHGQTPRETSNGTSASTRVPVPGVLEPPAGRQALGPLAHGGETEPGNSLRPSASGRNPTPSSTVTRRCRRALAADDDRPAWACLRTLASLWTIRKTWSRCRPAAADGGRSPPRRRRRPARPSSTECAPPRGERPGGDPQPGSPGRRRRLAGGRRAVSCRSPPGSCVPEVAHRLGPGDVWFGRGRRASRGRAEPPSAAAVRGPVRGDGRCRSPPTPGRRSGRGSPVGREHLPVLALRDVSSPNGRLQTIGTASSERIWGCLGGCRRRGDRRRCPPGGARPASGSLSSPCRSADRRSPRGPRGSS